MDEKRGKTYTKQFHINKEREREKGLSAGRKKDLRFWFPMV